MVDRRKYCRAGGENPAKRKNPKAPLSIADVSDKKIIILPELNST